MIIMIGGFIVIVLLVISLIHFIKEHDFILGHIVGIIIIGFIIAMMWATAMSEAIDIRANVQNVAVRVAAFDKIKATAESMDYSGSMIGSLNYQQAGKSATDTLISIANDIAAIEQRILTLKLQRQSLFYRLFTNILLVDMPAVEQAARELEAVEAAYSGR